LISFKKKEKLEECVNGPYVRCKKGTFMVDFQIVRSIGGTRWYSTVKQFYGLVNYYQELDPNDTVVIATIDDCLVGCCRLCQEHQSYVIRGLQVHPHYRGQGIGTELLKRISELLGSEECYCLPFTYLENLYGKVGFVKIDENAAPSWFYERYHHYKSQNLDVIIMKKGELPCNDVSAPRTLSTTLNRPKSIHCC
jgi:N-acetylglutamate synthase-like GNAT family acetyltransferase